jgi:RNA polymerase sigma factor (sigma-70 family)
MPPSQLDAVVRHIHQIMRDSGEEELTDRQLLELFARRRDENAFAELVRRHGPLVRGVCWRVLGHVQDAEDAFQATFLVLARKASSVRWRDSVHGWLYGVAHYMSKKIKRSALRRQANEAKANRSLQAAREPEATIRELGAAVDNELSAMPARYREPLLLCYLEGMTRDRAARQLRVSLRTLDRRLARGRELLRGRLGKQGVTLSAAMLVAGLADASASGTIPQPLVASTTRVAAAFAAKSTDAVTGRIAELACGVLRAMAAAKFKALATVLLGAGLLAVGGSVLGHKVYATGDPPAPQAPAPAKRLSEPESSREKTLRSHADQFGDPLPPGVIASMGSRRMRAGRQICAMDYSPDGKWLAAATENEVWIWDKTNGTVLRRIPSPGAWPVDVRFVSQSTLVHASGRSPARLRLLDILTGKELAVIEPKDALPVEVAIAPEGKRLAVACTDNTVRLVDSSSGKEICRVATGAGRLWNLAFSVSGDRLAVADSGDTLRIYETGSGRLAIELKQEEAQSFRAAAFSPDSRSLASVSCFWGNKCITTLWDLTSGKEVRRFKETEGLALDVTFSPNGQYVAGIRRRVAQLLDKVDSDVMTPDQLRGVRAVEALEYAGSGEARQLLQSLASGAAEARLTREAKASLARLRRPDVISH